MTPRLFMYSGNNEKGEPYLFNKKLDRYVAYQAAKFDYLVLDVEPWLSVPAARAELMRLRAFAPHLKILGLVRGPNAWGGPAIRIDDYWGINTDSYYRRIMPLDKLRLADGTRQGNININLANDEDAKNWTDELSKILQPECFDGLFIDQFVSTIGWYESVAKQPFDFAKAGFSTHDEFVDAYTKNFNAVGTTLRHAFARALLISNGGQTPPDGFSIMCERFPYQNRDWAANMDMASRDRGDNTLNVISVQSDVVYPEATDETARRARFGYGSALLTEHAAFTLVRSSFDPLRGHSPWWWDEYAVDECGRANGDPNYTNWFGEPEDVGKSVGPGWRRDFENGVVLVNPGMASWSIAVGGVRRILGNSAGNDGRVPLNRVVTVPPQDAVFLVKS